MRPRQTKLLFSACSIVGGSFLYVLLAFDHDAIEPAIIGPLLGFTLGAVFVLVTLWHTPRGLRRAYRREPTKWKDLPFAVWAFLAPFSAGFMVWVTGGLVVGGVAWLISYLLAFDWPESSGWGWVFFAWFVCAQVLTFRTWTSALDSG